MGCGVVEGEDTVEREEKRKIRNSCGRSGARETCISGDSHMDNC